MGVTNLEKDQESSHVKNAALFAIDLVHEATRILIDEEDPSQECINVRVGFHCGPVVSNVIGSLNPRYGLFGDTVNTSNRIESNSKANRILCSEAAYELMTEQAPEMSVQKRGKIAVKGKGDMVTYWVGDDELRSRLEKREAAGLENMNPEHAGSIRVAFGDDIQKDSFPIDGSLWGRDLQRKLTQSNTSEQVKLPIKVQDKANKHDSKNTPATMAGKKQIKEAVHMTRSSNVI